MRAGPEKDAQDPAETPAERQRRAVMGIFSAITPWYDFLNRLLSLRRDVAWRRRAVGAMEFHGKRALLDVATGTADLALMAARRNPGITVTGLDFVEEMLAVGREKVRREGLDGRINLINGDALALPFAEGSFDVVSIAFGIRNIPDRLLALKEMRRVVVPGGLVVVLELTTPANKLLRGLYKIYLCNLLPALGRAFSKDPGAYTYLAESISAFPPPDEFLALMEEAGLVGCTATGLTLGVAHLYVGRRPQA